MEYLLAKFPEDRGVIVNGAPGAWRTNQVLMLQAGTHFVTLEAPDDFTPSEKKVVLRQTSVATPKVIEFRKVV